MSITESRIMCKGFTNVFACYDLDGDGFISSTEYMTILNLLSDGGVNKLPFMFSRMDSNHDGRINLQEFLDGINEAVSRMKWSDVENLLSLLQNGQESKKSGGNQQELSEEEVLALQMSQSKELLAHDMQLPGELAKRFTLGETIGQGAFGKVFRAIDTAQGNTVVAFKAVVCPSGNEMLKKMTWAEGTLMGKLEHQNVLQSLGMVEDNNVIWIALEYMLGGDLREQITEHTKFNETMARGIMKQIFAGLSYLHDEVKIVHRDLKPANLLLRVKPASTEEVPQLVLSDFGLSTAFKSTKVIKLLCGTPHYLAPEIVKGDGYTRSVDCFSCGVIMYELLGGSRPFEGNTQEALFESIVANKVKFSGPAWSSMTESSIDLIQRLIEPRALQRLSVLEAINHPWTAGEATTESREMNVFELLAMGADSDDMLSDTTQ